MNEILYTIDAGNVLKIWNNSTGEGEPFLVQPNNPEGGLWADSEDAAKWARRYIAQVFGVVIPEPIAPETEPEVLVEELVAEVPVEETPAE